MQNKQRRLFWLVILARKLLWLNGNFSDDFPLFYVVLICCSFFPKCVLCVNATLWSNFALKHLGKSQITADGRDDGGGGLLLLHQHWWCWAYWIFQRSKLDTREATERFQCRCNVYSQYIITNCKFNQYAIKLRYILRAFEHGDWWWSINHVFLDSCCFSRLPCFRQKLVNLFQDVFLQQFTI